MCVEYKSAADGASALSNIFEAAGIDRQSLIQITGPDALVSLLWLCRHGFENVGYVKCGAPHPAEPVDALIIPHRCTPDALLTLLDGAPIVRPGGALIFRGVGRRSDGPTIETILARFGYQLQSHFGGNRLGLNVARRSAQFALAKAA